MSSSRCVVIAGTVFSIFGVLSAGAGAIVDGISAGVFNRETGCYHTGSQDAWGTAGGKEDAYACAVAYATTYLYSNSNLVYYSNSNNNRFNNVNNFNNYNQDFNNENLADFQSKYNCVCTDETLCYEYNMRSGSNCGNILTTYTDLLCVSTALCAVLCIISFVYSIFTCVGGCCSHHPAPHPPVHEMHPHGHYYSKAGNNYA